jgi:signal transduction histidine kinase
MVLDQLHQLGHSYRDWELDVHCKNGTTRTISWSNISRELAIPGWWSWGVGVDVTKQKQAEEVLKTHSAELETLVEERTRDLRETQEQLIRREKLALLGQMAGSLGHELRNPLATISNAVYYLNLISQDADATHKEYLEIIASETRAAEKIISDLLDFARIKRIEKKQIHIAELIDLVQEGWKPPDNVQLLLEFPDDIPEFLADRQHIKQALLNLMTNACEAMPQGGALTIQAAANQSQIEISLIDTGCGISEANMKKLFEPLFTTKTKGIGLGLTISKNLLEANGGHLTVRSRENHGSTFSLTFPLQGEGG